MNWLFTVAYLGAAAYAARWFAPRFMASGVFEEDDPVDRGITAFISLFVGLLWPILLVVAFVAHFLLPPIKEDR